MRGYIILNRSTFSTRFTKWIFFDESYMKKSRLSSKFLFNLAYYLCDVSINVQASFGELWDRCQSADP